MLYPPAAEQCAWQQSYLDLVNNDTALMAVHYGRVAIGNSLGAIFCNPIMAGLADAYGRVPFQVFGRIGWIIFWVCLGQPWMTLRGRLFLEWGCWGVVQAGVWSAFAAQHSDIFATRPELSSRIKTTDRMYSNMAGFVAP